MQSSRQIEKDPSGQFIQSKVTSFILSVKRRCIHVKHNNINRSHVYDRQSSRTLPTIDVYSKVYDGRNENSIIEKRKIIR